MKGFLRFLNSSIGKKMVMGLTGLMLCLFLVGHLGGNLLLYKSPESFNHYAETLTSNPFLVPIELGLLFVYLVHVIFAIRVTLANWRARPKNYALDEAVGGRNVASYTMIWSGLLIFIFVIVHLQNFKWGARLPGEELYGLVIREFKNPWVCTFYVVSMIVLMLHLRHGFRSAFQSLGVLYEKIDVPMRWAGIVFAVVIGGGFLLIPLWAKFIHP